MEYSYLCPYCWQTIETEIDSWVSEQTYVEDCQVCCQPIEIHYRFYQGTLDCFEVRQENGGEWS